MVSLRSLLIASLLFTNISCSNKVSKSIASSKKPTPSKDATDTPKPSPAPAVTAPSPVVGEKFVDAYTSVLIQEIKNQLSNDPLSNEKRIQNVEFANRIFKINYKFGSPSELSIITHTDKVFNFTQTSTQGNAQYFNAYENSKEFILSERGPAIFSAEAKTFKSARDHKTVTIIKIKDVESGAIVHIFYVKKSGVVTYSFVDGFDYGRELTKTSKIFLDRLKENPSVVGEFYGVITEDANVSNASRFNLIVSDNFTLESQPLVNHFRQDQPNLVPLSVDYRSFWKLFFFGSTAYKVIKDSSYIIESERNPVELTALNLELKIEAQEKIKGQKSTLPLRLFVKFR
jgi:hypothetical protein